MIPDITDAFIEEMIQTTGMARAGLSYWRQGRVTKLMIDPDTNGISALVQGSERNPYSVAIYFDSDSHIADTVAECTCPLGSDCKHCAAVLYAARSLQISGANSAASNASTRPRPVPPARPDPLPQPLIFRFRRRGDQQWGLPGLKLFML